MKKFLLMMVVVFGCVFGTKALAWEYYYYPCYTAPVVYTPTYYYTTPVVYTTPYYGGYYYRPYCRPYYHYYRPYCWGW